MKLTLRLLNAMSEALAFRTAGDLEDEDIPVEDYEDAHQWVEDQRAKREQNKLARQSSK